MSREEICQGEKNGVSVRNLMRSNPLAIAQSYLKCGRKPIPVPYRTKKAIIKDWPELTITLENVDQYFNGMDQNIGVQMGSQSGGLCDADLDSPEAVRIASYFLPVTESVFGRKSKPSSHRLYVLNDPDPITVIQYKDENGKMIVELRIGADGGAMTVFPGSVHEEGEPIEWVTDGKPSVVPFAELKEAVRNVAIAALLLKHWPDDGTHELSLCVGGFLARSGLNADDVEYMIETVGIESGMNQKKAKDDARTARDAARSHAKGKKSYGFPKLKKLMGEKVAEAFRKILNSDNPFECNDKGVPFPSQGNIRIALQELGVTVSYDEFQDRSIISGMEGFDLLDDRAMDRLWLIIDESFGFRPTKEFFWTVVCDEARRNLFHPVRQHLDALEWDGVKRLDRWLIDYGEAEDTKFNRAVGAIALVAAVRRVRQPGCKFDEMLVLQSAQGMEKSSALSTLAVNPIWFTDDLPLSADSKTVIERMKGRWIVEAAELKGMRGAAVEHLKSFLSRQADRARMSYDRTTSELKRQCVIFGTTNSDEFLLDQTGNRRYWPVRVGKFDLDKLKRDRDQLWAEAATREAEGMSIRLPRELWSDAEQQQKERTVDEPWIELVEHSSGDINGKLLASDAWKLLNDLPEHQRTQYLKERLGVAMRACGWKRQKERFGKNTKWAYVRGLKPYRELMVDYTKKIVTRTAREKSEREAAKKLVSRA